MSATLNSIRTKVRRLTASPSSASLSDSTIDQYINAFYVYDFPEHLRLFNLKETYEFYTQPNIDVYNFPANTYLTVNPPAYIAGYQSFYTQSREQFYRIYPALQTFQQIDTGDNTTGPFSGTLTNIPVLRGYQKNPVYSITSDISNITQATTAVITTIADHNFVTNDLVTFANVNGMVEINNLTGRVNYLSSTSFTVNIDTSGFTAYSGPSGTASKSSVTSRVLVNTIDTNNNGMTLQDNGFGILFGDGNGTIDYLTGAITCTFSSSVPGDQPINTQTIPYNASRPQAILFFDDQFIIQPVPDQSYQVSLEVFRSPIAFANTPDTQIPELKEWWQLLAFGAARKILIDRMDLASVQAIEPFYQEQMNLCLRRTLVQQTNERTSTIYTEQVQFPFGNYFNRF